MTPTNDERTNHFELRVLVAIGAMMAEHLRKQADALDRQRGIDPLRAERALPAIWEQQAEEVRRAYR